jgi:hypothetical protein
VLLVRRALLCLAQIQVWFAGGEKCRTYLLIQKQRPPRGRHQTGRLYVDSVKLDRLYRTAPALAVEMEATGLFPPHDLRQTTEASKAREELEALPPELIDKLLAEGGQDLKA